MGTTPGDLALRERVVTGAAAPARRRGRPYRLPVDPTPHDTLQPGYQHRLAWLLGASRVYADDPAVARRSTFIEALRELGVPADPTKLSRWESGRSTVPLHVVTGYERLLGLPAGQLGVAATGFGQGVTRGPVLVPDIDLPPTHVHARLDTLFERTLAGGAPGLVWLDLCTVLTDAPFPYLLPETWQRICDLLAAELVHAAGGAFVCRFEALRLLVAHAGSRRYAAKAIGSVVTDQAAVFLLHPASLFGEVDDATPMDLLLRLLRQPPGALRTGATWALNAKIRRGDLDGRALNAVQQVSSHIMQSGENLASRLDALALEVVLPDTERRRSKEGVLDREGRTALNHVRRGSELCEPAYARQIAARVADAAQESTPIDYLLGQDQMLHRLVREALFHADPGRRAQAGLLLSASPYRAQLAEPLVRLVGSSDENTALLAMAALYQIAGSEQQATLLRIAQRDARFPVRICAMLTVGQLATSLSEADSASLAQRALADENEMVRSCALHVLGMAGAETGLAAVEAGDPTMAAAVEWWRKHTAIREAAGPEAVTTTEIASRDAAEL